ncbi:GTP-binding protein [Candidatus Saccharibacteria bacterium]|nr:GTP-binding protein [Candidatus Saccharibacteria bacterium]
MTKKIPVLCITGFLGAGKTTTINNLLADSQGTKVGIIMNDFGAINIDALLVAHQTDELIELASGCICCLMDENSLDEPLALLAHENSQLDVIIIEASGLAEPRDLAHKVVTTDNKFTTYGGLVYLVDALNFPSTFQKHQAQITASLKSSDLIIVNKSKNPTNIINQIKSITDTPIISTPDATINPKLLFDLRPNRTKQLALSAVLEPTPHLHDNFTSASFTEKFSIDPVAFTKFIRTLPPEIYRAKGIVYFGLKGYEQKFLFQKVGSRYELTHHEWLDSEKPITKLVFLGPEINKDQLKQSFHNLIDKNPTDLTPENMLRL